MNDARTIEEAICLDAIRRAVEAEREACAKVAEEFLYSSTPYPLEIAKRIRARDCDVNITKSGEGKG